MSPRVSVIIPTYNRAGLLSTAIDSVLAQTYANLEVIVVDDGSTDGTSEVVGGYADPRVVGVHVEHTGVLGAVRNAGLARAGGEWVAFLDSDDAWLPEKLDRQATELERRPEVGLVCTNAEIVDGRDALTGAPFVDPGLRADGHVFERLVGSNFVIVSTVLARRALVERVGRFAEMPLLHGVEDYDLWLRLALVTEFVYIPSALALYRKHPGSMNQDADLARHWRALLCIMDRTQKELQGRADGRASLRAVSRRRETLLIHLAEAEGHTRRPVALLRRARAQLRLRLSA
jgi:glycosyltransferase involved in cell wall biosynthesis